MIYSGALGRPARLPASVDACPRLAPEVARSDGRALAVDARSYRHVASILKHNLDRTPLEEAPDDDPIEHENIRGPDH